MAAPAVCLLGQQYPADNDNSMISHLHRCIHIHIPKTAGNSVNRAFGVDWQSHQDLGSYAGELPSDVVKYYYKFAIVRNPWERLLSDYNYQKKKSRPAASKLFLFDDHGAKRSFRAWVEAVLADPFRYDPASWGGRVSDGIHRWSPQVDWITLDGRISVDRVVRWERLHQDFPAIARAVRLPVSRLPRRNRRFHLHYSWYYDAATEKKVGTYYAKDVDAFQFRFENFHPRPLSRAATRLFRRATLRPSN